MSLSLVSRQKKNKVAKLGLISSLEISEPFARFSPGMRFLSMVVMNRKVSKSVSLSLVSRPVPEPATILLFGSGVSKSVSLSLVSRRQAIVILRPKHVVSVSKSVSLSLVSRRVVTNEGDDNSVVTKSRNQ